MHGIMQCPGLGGSLFYTFKIYIRQDPRPNDIKIVCILRIFVQARVFVRLGWKSLPRTSTLAYYEHL
jgi:hypothetical protein